MRIVALLLILLTLTAFTVTADDGVSHPVSLGELARKADLVALALYQRNQPVESS